MSERIKQLEAKVAEAKRSVRSTMTIGELSKESIRDVITEVGETHAYLDALFNKSDNELKGSTVSFRDEMKKLVQEGRDADSRRLKEIQNRIKEITMVASETGDEESEFIKEYGMAAESGIRKARKFSSRAEVGPGYGEGLFRTVFGDRLTTWINTGSDRGVKKRSRADLRLKAAQADLSGAMSGSSETDLTPAEAAENRREGEVRQKDIQKKEDVVIDLLQEIKAMLGGVGGVAIISNGENNNASDGQPGGGPGAGGGIGAALKEFFTSPGGLVGAGGLLTFLLSRGRRGRLPGTTPRGTTPRGTTPRGTTPPPSTPKPPTPANRTPTHTGNFNGHKWPDGYIDPKTGNRYLHRGGNGSGAWQNPQGRFTKIPDGKVPKAPRMKPKFKGGSAVWEVPFAVGYGLQGGIDLANQAAMNPDIVPEGMSTDEYSNWGIAAGAIQGLDMFGQAEMYGFESTADLADGVAALFGRSRADLEMQQMEIDQSRLADKRKAVNNFLDNMSAGFDRHTPLGKRIFYGNQYTRLQVLKHSGIDELQVWMHNHPSFRNKPISIKQAEEIIIMQLAVAIAEHEAQMNGKKKVDPARVQQIAEQLRKGDFKLPGDNRLGIGDNTVDIFPSQFGDSRDNPEFGSPSDTIHRKLLEHGVGGPQLKPYLQRELFGPNFGTESISIPLSPVSMTPSVGQINNLMQLDKNAAGVFEMGATNATALMGSNTQMAVAQGVSVTNTQNYFADAYDESSFMDTDRANLFNDVNYNIRYS